VFINTVFTTTPTILITVYTLWNATVPSLTHVAGIQYFLIYQRIPAYVLGNSLGLYPDSHFNTLLLLSITWNDASDDALVNGVAQILTRDIEAATKAVGLYQRFKYLNYAAEFQDPIGSYESQRVADLKRVSRKYDPQRLFQTRVRGGFKLFKDR
jgi:hypothetical protein